MTASHFDPVFDHTTNNNADLIDEIKELADVIGDGGDVRVGPLQVLLVYLANALHALIHLPSICNNQSDTISGAGHICRLCQFPNFYQKLVFGAYLTKRKL